MRKIITSFICVFQVLILFSQRTLVAPLPTSRIYPRVINGDRDFWGNGPRISGNVVVSISEGKGQLFALINMKLEETSGDRSTAEIKDERRLIYNAPAGKQIKSIVNPASQTTSFDYKLTRGGASRINAPRGGPVSHLIVMGDTGGSDIGNNTADDSYVSVYFAGMVVELEPLPAGVREIVIGKRVFTALLTDKFRGTTGRINTFGPRNGNSWFKADDSWIKFPAALNTPDLPLTGLSEIVWEGWRYYYNDINLQTITARAPGQYLQVNAGWEQEGPEARGECVENAGCFLGAPSIQLNELNIQIEIRPSAESGKLTYDSKDIQVNFDYKYGADCGILSFLCDELFRDKISSAFFRTRFMLISALAADGTRNSIAGALTNGVMEFIRAASGTSTASEVVGISEKGSNLLIRYR